MPKLSANTKNASVLEDLLKQGGIGDKTEMNDITNCDHVTIIHGDLVTAEQISVTGGSAK